MLVTIFDVVKYDEFKDGAVYKDHVVRRIRIKTKVRSVEEENEIAKALQLKINDSGYIIVDNEQRTSIRGVYAAGDITGGLRQVVTACAKVLLLRYHQLRYSVKNIPIKTET
jgi:thioredoxin reductase